MTIDISAELIEISNEQYYADWELDETETQEGESRITISISGYDDAEYLDISPIFDIIQDTHSSIGDSFYLKEVSFSPQRTPSATVILTNNDIRSGDSVDEFEVTGRTGREYLLTEETCSKIDYSEPPLIVGYCNSEEKLTIE